jgi:uncharacterized protein YfaT (DUF1175 family)
MCPLDKHVRKTALSSRSKRLAELFGVFLTAAMLAATGITRTILRHGPRLAETSRSEVFAAGTLPAPRRSSPVASWHDSLGDGFPDGARLDGVQDRENFTRWFTFLAESQYYAASPRTAPEVRDCAALVRFAYRNSLVAHSPAWREDARLPFDPGFGDITKYHYPYGPLGKALFRTRPGPVGPDDLAQGAFEEFADSATLLRYNTYRISRDVRAAVPGDLLLFHQALQREPFHTMLFVGRSYYQPQGSDWIVYHTGDIDGHHGEIREVQTSTLMRHPDLRWRPVLNNPNFLGVYRLEILR